MTLAKRLGGGKKDVDMTTGSTVKHLIAFSLPLLAGNIFQQLYNLVDTWTVGNFVSNEAFSAVGSVTPIVNMLIGAFIGLSSGAGVVISQFYGAHNDKKVHDAVHTAMLMTIILGVVLTVIGELFIPLSLRMMDTPPEVVPESTAYLRIYFGGLMGLMVYNMGSGILRAVGDSRRPFYFLVVCAVVNVALDLIFVLKFHMGVDGVAWATIIAQAVSAVLVVIELMRYDAAIRLKIRDLKMSRDMLGKIVKIGIPAALQMAITAFSNIFVMSYINHFGADCMSGWTAYNKIDMLMFLPMQSIALASTTFVGQNLGSGQEERAKNGSRIALFLAMGITAVLLVPVMLFAPQLTAFFNSKPEVVEFGTLMLRWISPFYLLTCINQVYSGALRGAGNSTAPMVFMLCSFVLFRQCYLFIMSHFISYTVLPIAMSYPAGWLVCSLITLIYYRKVSLTKHSVIS